MSRYIETVGRRKTAGARVRITEASKRSIVINGKPYTDYFTVKEHQAQVVVPFEHLEEGQHFTVTALVKGGGVSAQAEAVRHGISRGLVEWKLELRKPLKKAGLLKRDPRAVERKKFGLKKARKAGQWSKR